MSAMKKFSDNSGRMPLELVFERSFEASAFDGRFRVRSDHRILTAG